MQQLASKLAKGLLASVVLASDTAAAAGAASTESPAKKAEPKTVADDMVSRRILANPEEALAYLGKCNDDYTDFASQAFAAPGVNMETGKFDPAIYNEGMRVMVATLRSVQKGSKSSTKAIVVAPVPTLDSLLEDEAGRDWVQKIIDKELNHVAVRPLRDAEDISTVVDQMPTTRDAYISSARGEGGGILQAFDELYKSINAAMSAKIPVWAKARLIKGELKKAFESKGYANEYYPALENRGEGKESLFVIALNLSINGAKAKGYDATIFERWLSTRDAKAFTAGATDEDEDNFDVDSLTTAMLAEDKKPEAPADQAAPQA